MKKFDKFINFVKFTHKFRRIKRAILINGSSRLENDMEHSYQLALVAWFLNEDDNLKLDSNLLIKYSLVHDLVEIYAGDAHFYHKSERVGKKQREAKAAKRIQKEFPKFASLHKLIKQYESLATKESKFIYALDKLLPIVNIYLDDGRSWRRDGVTLKMLIDGKTQKIKKSPEVEKYFNVIVKILKRQEKMLFQSKQAKTI